MFGSLVNNIVSLQVNRHKFMHVISINKKGKSIMGMKANGKYSLGRRNLDSLSSFSDHM